MGELSKFKFISLQNLQQYQVRGVEGKGGGKGGNKINPKVVNGGGVKK